MDDGVSDLESVGSEQQVGVSRSAAVNRAAAVNCELKLGLQQLHSPERIADDEEGDVKGVGVGQDVVRLGLDHVTVRNDDLLAIECFL